MALCHAPKRRRTQLSDMSYVSAELRENNREPDCFPQQQLHRKCPANNNNNNGDNEDNKNNDVEMKIGGNSKPSANGIQLDATSNATATSNAVATSNATATSNAVATSNGDNVDGEVPETAILVRGCSREDQGLKNDPRKCRLSIKHETVIVSRIDRILDASGERTSLYKCHLCGKLGTSLEKVRRHLVTHSRRLPFRCPACDARFQLRSQLSFHVKAERHAEDAAAERSDRRTEAVPVNPVTQQQQQQSPDSCVDGGGTPVELLSSSAGGSDGRSDAVVVTAREPTVAAKSSACDEGVVRTRADVTINYSNGDYSPKDYSSSSVASVRAAATSSLNQTPAFTLCRTNDDPPSKGGATVHNNNNNNNNNNNSESQVDSSMGMDMTCRSRSQQNVQGQGQGDRQHDRSGANAEMALHNSTRSGGGGGVVAVDLATKIRETEHLSDDVTVVIPSDVPLNNGHEAAKRDGGGGDDDNESESTTCPSNKIIHAPPHRSILGNSHHLRTKRRLSSSASTTSQQQSAEPSPPKLAVPHQAKLHPATAAAAALPMSVYNPLALSGFVQGFGGLMSSSLLSPIITQTPLGFPGMLVNPLSLYAAQLSSSSIASLMNAKAAAAAASLSCGGQRDGSSSGASSQAKTLGDGAAGGRIKEEPPGGCSSSSSSNGCCSSTSDGYASPNSKCSSLSRTHSRLNVIQKPIKRENAYKPIIMSDGRTAYHCLYCNKNFCTISDVNRHMDFHEDIRPYKCRFCSYYARTNSQLKVHMMRHQGIRDFLCRLCNYKGVTQSDLNRHTKSQIHMMKERNVCALCREGFVSLMNLEQHRIEKHFKMENCGDGGGVKYHLTMAGLVKENAAN